MLSILFVDPAVESYETLLQTIDSDVSMVMLDLNRNGIEQITEVLNTQQDLTSIQILSHGAAGQIQLGNATLTSTNLESYREALRGWGEALTPDGDILLYGCNVAADQEDFIQRLSEMTQAEVAASQNLTGSSDLGGDWRLEAQTGLIETTTAFDPTTYAGALQIYAVTNTANSGTGSLRQAILNAASNPGQQYRVKDLAQALLNEQGQRLSCGNGSKGERIYDWARIEVNCSNEHGMKRWILLRRNIEKPDDPLSITYYQVYAPANITLEEMVLVAGQRWRIEECFAIAKDKLGLSEYEVRSWVGWHRHMTLVMAAQAFLTVLRHQVEPMPVPKKSLQDRGQNRTSMAAFKAARGLLSH